MYSLSTKAVCGDGLLGSGELCDDGNALSGDGCSALCALEAYSGMDCDLIGAPCLPQCGWGTQLHSYVLPNSASCVNHSYFDYQSCPTRSPLASFSLAAAPSFFGAR